jgi:hypothetical protein
VRGLGCITVLPALCFFTALGGLGLYLFGYNSPPNTDDAVYESSSQAEISVKPVGTEYLVRPEAPEIGVNIIKELHQRPPATDAEAAEWLGKGEMVTVPPSTPVHRVRGLAEGYCISVEVLDGPQQGLRGWVWLECLRDNPYTLLSGGSAAPP